MTKAVTSQIMRAIPLLITIFSLSLPAYAKYSGGTGEPDDPYQITTTEDLIKLGDSPEDYNKHFILTADIDLDPNLPGRKVFDKAVIAPDTDPNDTYSWFQGSSFKGVFDGNGHAIKDLKVTGEGYLGLFGRLSSTARVSNLGLEAAEVSGAGNYIGGLVGENWGGVVASYSTASVGGKDKVGGLAGSNYGGITLSYSSGSVSGTAYVGGLVGRSEGTIVTSYSSSSVSGNQYVGGLAGFNRLRIVASYTTGSVSGTGSATGGLVGRNSESISASCSSASVNGREYVGGLVGENSGPITDSYASGSVSGISNVGGLVGANWYGPILASRSTGSVSGNDRIGGLVGWNLGFIGSSYGSGSVNGSNSVGGLAGSNVDVAFIGLVFNGTIANSYSSGSVSGTNAIGGLVGYSLDRARITASFWDMETSGLVASAGGAGLTTDDMQTAKTFLEAGWDFVGETENGSDDIWKIWDGYDYPHLAWEPGPNTPLVFVDINDPGFYGQMSKYEVTNAQYCDFLNATLASSDITVNGNDVYGAVGSNSGEDYAGQRYYRCDGSGYTGYGATNGGAARIHYNESAFSLDEGFGNHPVTYVSWYGAMAFCNYYGYYLPTEEQWQAVADYDGTYIYGCGETIYPGIANYRNSEHPDGTTTVGSFGIYGYGMSDMAGNVWEWTSSSLDSNRIFRGGSLGSIDNDCAVSIRGDGIPYANYWDIGFRVCR